MRGGLFIAGGRCTNRKAANENMKPEIHQNLNLSIILNPVPVGRDTVRGTLPGDERLEIVVSRRWKCWEAQLRVTVGGHVVHWQTTSKSDQEQFEELRRRAASARFNDDEHQAEERVLQAAKAANLWKDSLL
jgi:hypothetical protein